MNDFINGVLGPGNTVASFLVNYFFAGVGVALLVLSQAVKRDPSSTRTPFKFSWSFLAYDNAKRFLYNAILIFVYLRFLKQLTGFDVDEWKSFLVGFSVDGLMSMLKNANILDKNKSELAFEINKAVKNEDDEPPQAV